MSKAPPGKMPSSTPRKKRSLLVVILLIMAGGFILFVLFVLTVLFFVWKTSLTNTVGKVSFDRQLPVPALAASAVAPDGTRTFDLTLQTGKTAFTKGAQTETWGVNGAYLGPTIRAKRGEKVQLFVKNTLPEDTSLHWHGMHLPASMDGGPHQPIKSGATWSPNWTINQPAATLWYHPHPHGKTEQHVYRGIAGMFIVDDDTEAATHLPHTYGVDDVPVIVQDKKIKKDGQLEKLSGNVGKDIVVNGALTPHLRLTTQHIRLRLLNGSSSRIYNFGLSNDQPMQLIASDGGLLERPIAQKRVLLSPGERAEVLVSLQPGEQAVLRSYPAKIGANFFVTRSSGGDDTMDIMQLRASASLTPSEAVPEQLTTIPRLAQPGAATTRTFRLSGFKINGKSMDMNRIDVTATKDTTEFWEVTNTDTQAHNFHIHDVQFQVLSLNGSAPPPELHGNKDTVLMLPGRTVRLAVQFADYSDATHPYMFHCHLLSHEDQGMMGQFVVVEPGQAAAPDHHSGSHH